MRSRTVAEQLSKPIMAEIAGGPGLLMEASTGTGAPITCTVYYVPTLPFFLAEGVSRSVSLDISDRLISPIDMANFQGSAQ